MLLVNRILMKDYDFISSKIIHLFLKLKIVPQLFGSISVAQAQLKAYQLVKLISNMKYLYKTITIICDT